MMAMYLLVSSRLCSLQRKILQGECSAFKLLELENVEAPSTEGGEENERNPAPDTGTDPETGDDPDTSEIDTGEGTNPKPSGQFACVIPPEG